MTKQTSSRKKKEPIEAKCGNCGEKVNSNQKFCPGCGAEMDWSSVDDEPEEKPAKKPATKNKSATTKTAANKSDIDKVEQNAIEKRKKWAIAGAVGFVGMFIVVGTTPDGEEPGSLAMLFLTLLMFSILNVIILSVGIKKYRKEKEEEK